MVLINASRGLALGGVLLLLAPHISASTVRVQNQTTPAPGNGVQGGYDAVAPQGQDITGGIVEFPPANVPKEVNGMPPVPEAVGNAVDEVAPGAGSFFTGLFDQPDCGADGCSPPSPAPPPVWLQPVSPPFDASAAPPLGGQLGGLVDDATNTTKTDSDGSDLDGFLGFRVYSVSEGDVGHVWIGLGMVVSVFIVVAAMTSRSAGRKGEAAGSGVDKDRPTRANYGSVAMTSLNGISQDGLTSEV